MTFKKKVPQRLARAREEHQRFLNEIGWAPDMKLKREMPPPLVENPRPRDDKIPGGVCPLRDKTIDHRWKRGQDERPEVAAAMDEKKLRLAPAYSKGPVQYITPGADPTDIGKKK